MFASTAFAAQAEINVVASIKPVHSLVASVMAGVATPSLIVEGAGSPHTYALKPSQAKMLQSADLVFWIGHELEAFLEKPLDSIAANAEAVELMGTQGLVKLELREEGAFDAHDHGEEHAERKDHDNGEPAEGHEAHDEDGRGEFDVHVWLDPVNAKAMVRAIKGALADADAENAEKYEANAEAVMKKLDALVAEISAELEHVKGKGYIVFHDAYQNFENRFGVFAAGSITVSPEVMPGAQRIGEIRAKVQELDAACIFAEPQFEPKLVSTVTEGTQAKSGVLDPLGAELEGGPDLYFELIRNMATSIKNCLSAAS